MAKINIGGVLDSDGDWAGALDAFEEGYRHVPFVQINALYYLFELANLGYVCSCKGSYCNLLEGYHCNFILPCLWFASF